MASPGFDVVRKAIDSGEPQRLWLAYLAAASAHEKVSFLNGLADWFRRRDEPGDVQAAGWCRKRADDDWRRALLGIGGPTAKECGNAFSRRVHWPG